MRYETPEMLILILKAEDVIKTSSLENVQDPNEGFDFST